MRFSPRLWQRDLDVIREAGRSAMLTSQIARLHRFPSRKKAAERLGPLHHAGLLKRIPYFQPAMQGKPEFLYFTGARPHPRLLSHTIGVAEIHVLLAEWLRDKPQFEARFLYGSEQPTKHGIIPDATILISKSGDTTLTYVEVDNATEPVNSTTGYSLAAKLRAYAAFFDSQAYKDEFPSLSLSGFRVALIVPPGRAPHVLRLLADEHHDFVVTTTPALLKEGLHQAAWSTCDGSTVDFLGRAWGFDRGTDQVPNPHHGAQETVFDQQHTQPAKAGL